MHLCLWHTALYKFVFINLFSFYVNSKSRPISKQASKRASDQIRTFVDIATVTKNASALTLTITLVRYSVSTIVQYSDALLSVTEDNGGSWVNMHWPMTHVTPHPKGDIIFDPPTTSTGLLGFGYVMSDDDHWHLDAVMQIGNLNVWINKSITFRLAWCSTNN